MDSDVPTPEAAYADAPNIVREIGWVAVHARTTCLGETADREYWLRKTALLDRIALDEAATYAPDAAAPAVHVAEEAAERFVQLDRERFGRRGPEGATADVCRAYVRQQYLAWSRAQRL